MIIMPFYGWNMILPLKCMMVNVWILLMPVKIWVKITKVRNSASDGSIPKRLENGYIYLVKCKISYNGLVNFFKEGGMTFMNIWI